MNLTFQQQLDEELLHSERKRTIILIFIFLFGIGYRFVEVFIFKINEEIPDIKSSWVLWVVPLGIILFELFSLLYINRRIKKKRKKIPMVMQYINTGFEVCLPSMIILIVAREYPDYDILKSPALYIYFLFIILSTLRLSFSLSFFCGLLAAASYVVFRSCISGHFNDNDGIRATILLLSGIAAGLVAKQIKSSINKSLREAERRQKVENLFGQQLSTEVAEKMLAGDGKIESKRTNVAILFIDIRNFSRFAIGRSPEEVIKYQNSFFQIVINTVSKHNGIVHQFLGDGCMVTFGAPVDLENPSQYAVDAGMNLLKNISDAVNKGQIPDTKIGLGVHTGEVVTGNIGTKERQQYAITGNVVILAARLEQLNKQFNSQLLVSEDVIRAIDSRELLFTRMDDVELKGWQEPISIYKIV